MLLNHFTPPDKADVTSRLRGRLTALEAARLGLIARRHQSQDVDLCRVEAGYWLACNQDLLHPLSGKWLKNQAGSALRAYRDIFDEIELARQARQALRGIEILSPDELAAWICSVNRLAVRGGGGLRTTHVSLSADRYGRQSTFAPPDDLRRQLELLSSAAQDWEDHRGFRALLVLVAILAIHPFVDGNGRTARACFNAVLADELVSPFVPLRMIFDCSSGGFEIRLRDAIFNGAWGGLVSYLTVILDRS